MPGSFEEAPFLDSRRTGSDEIDEQEEADTSAADVDDEPDRRDSDDEEEEEADDDLPEMDFGSVPVSPAYTADLHTILG
jgi:hypothetical protein